MIGQISICHRNGINMFQNYNYSHHGSYKFDSIILLSNLTDNCLQPLILNEKETLFSGYKIKVGLANYS